MTRQPKLILLLIKHLVHEVLHGSLLSILPAESPDPNSAISQDDMAHIGLEGAGRVGPTVAGVGSRRKVAPIKEEEDQF